ncbi:MAG: hypothetical protein HY050_07930 [Actinobacteria bacterium]|nr:hypothetical protein [Actinomycetota bacterium]
MRGVRIVYGDRAIVDLIGQSEMDFIYLDQQHGIISTRDIYEISAFLARYKILVLVRTSDQSSVNIGLALDAGAHGVIAPDIESANQALAFISNTRFPPFGRRSWGAFAAGQRGYATPGEVANPICWALIESSMAVAQIEQIAQVDGLDGIYIGRYDLALSMNVPIAEIAIHESHNVAIKNVRFAAERVGLPIGTSGDFAQLSSQGFRILTVSSELELVTQGLKNCLSTR